MKRILLAGIFLSASTAAYAQTFGGNSNHSSGYVSGYTTGNGTYVQPHYRSAPNGTQTDNYGSSGNMNPYTGQAGTRAPRW